MSVTLRPARPADAEIAATLIAETMGGYGVMTMGLGSLHREVTILVDWFSRAGNRFSYEYCWLAEIDQKVVGLLLTLPGDKLGQLERSLAKGILNYYSIFEVAQLLWRLMVIGRSDEAEPNEYILSHLAVSEPYRKQGIAGKLIQKAEELAIKNGFSRLVLEVELDNLPAQALYRKHGFELQFITEFGRHARTLACPGYQKLVKIVPTGG